MAVEVIGSTIRIPAADFWGAIRPLAEGAGASWPDWENGPDGLSMTIVGDDDSTVIVTHQNNKNHTLVITDQ